MKWFKGITTLKVLKSVYRELCKQHHPDLGGDVNTMKEINLEYERALQFVTNDKGETLKEEEIRVEADLMSVLEKITPFKGLDIEICGRWIWVGGDTMSWKQQLKALKFFWASKKMKWYWRPEDAKVFKRKGYKGMDMDSIREKYGSKTFGYSRRESLA